MARGYRGEPGTAAPGSTPCPKRPARPRAVATNGRGYNQSRVWAVRGARLLPGPVALRKRAVEVDNTGARMRTVIGLAVMLAVLVLGAPAALVAHADITFEPRPKQAPPAQDPPSENRAQAQDLARTDVAPRPEEPPAPVQVWPHWTGVGVALLGALVLAGAWRAQRRRSVPR